MYIFTQSFKEVSLIKAYFVALRVLKKHSCTSASLEQPTVTQSKAVVYHVVLLYTV